MGCLVREAFQSVFQNETVTWQMSTNLLKSCEQNSGLREIAIQIQAVNDKSSIKFINDNCATELLGNYSR